MEPYTVGVEEEYQLVDPETGELVSRARDVLSLDWAGEAEHEVQETQVEIGTRICGSAAELDEEIRRLRFQVAAAAAAGEMAPVAAGLHPFSRWRDQEHTDAPRYRRLMEHYGRVLESEHIFGMHVHIGVPKSRDRMDVIRRIRPYLAHLLALSTSSPIYEGEDTGYASYRTILNERLPCAGPPPGLLSEPAYWAFTAALIQQGVAVDEGTTYWTARPHHRYPTIEIRCADVCPRVDDAVGIATLARALVAAAVEEVLPLPTAEGPGTDALLAADQWKAARSGLHGRVHEGGEEPIPFKDAIRRLRDRLGPTAERLGDSDRLAWVDDIIERGTAADRIREVAAAEAGLQPLVSWLARETLLGTGLDRRTEQREGPPKGAPGTPP